MDLQHTLIEKPIIELVNFCNDKGFDVIPVMCDKKWLGMIFYKDKFLKQGIIKYNTYNECEREIYNKIYKSL